MLKNLFKLKNLNILTILKILLASFFIYILLFTIVNCFFKLLMSNVIIFKLVTLVFNCLMAVIGTLLSIIGLLITIAFYTLAERKVLGGVQRRQGPHVVGGSEIGISGILQPIGDGLKLIIKELLIPSRANFQLFIIAPMLLFTLSLTIWTVIPFSSSSVIFYSEFSLLLAFGISSLSIFGIILAGWASNSAYAFIGALRSTAQMISYEITIGFILVGVVLWSQSLNLVEIVKLQEEVFFFWPLWPLALLMFISALAETNRVPFDLTEAEAELVAGYNVEYSCILFALFFLAEYSFMLSMSALIVLLFFGGWYAPISILFWTSGSFWFILKTCVVAFLLILVRATLPRVRFDQLMNFGWKKLLPIVIGYIIFLAAIVYVINLHNFSLPFIKFIDILFIELFNDSESNTFRFYFLFFKSFPTDYIYWDKFNLSEFFNLDVDYDMYDLDLYDWNRAVIDVTFLSAHDNFLVDLECFYFLNESNNISFIFKYLVYFFFNNFDVTTFNFFYQIRQFSQIYEISEYLLILKMSVVDLVMTF